jgi:hypothetical protein
MLSFWPIQGQGINRSVLNKCPTCATFNNISVVSRRSVLLVDETGENHLPAASPYGKAFHNIVWIEHNKMHFLAVWKITPSSS